MELLLSGFSLLFSLCALGFSFTTWRTDFAATRYDEADQRLSEIHRLEIEHPEFRNPEYCAKAATNPDPNIRYSYDAFACIIWNYIEAMYDRFNEKELRQSSHYFAMRSLSTLHKEWALLEENKADYAPELFKFLRLAG